MKLYLVTVHVDGTITNKLIRAASPEEAEKEALRCASQEITGSKLEHDLLASIDKSMRADARKRRKKVSVVRPGRKYSHAWHGQSLGGTKNEN